jgi:hypothetical protein
MRMIISIFQYCIFLSRMETIQPMKFGGAWIDFFSYSKFTECTVLTWLLDIFIIAIYSSWSM